jgi:hypothetical protein
MSKNQQKNLSYAKISCPSKNKLRCSKPFSMLLQLIFQKLFLNKLKRKATDTRFVAFN